MKLVEAEDKKLFLICAWACDAVETSSLELFIYTDKLLYIRKLYNQLKGMELGYTNDLLKQLKPLGVKKSWIKDMEELGILTPFVQVLMEIESREVPVKVWNLKEIDASKIEEFVRWKEEKNRQAKEKAKERLREGGAKFREKLKAEREKVKETITILKNYHPFLEIALYLYHLNHYAKTPEYGRYSDEIYDLKLSALLKAYELYPELFRLSFIPRGDRVWYCEECSDELYEEWRCYHRDFYSFGEFLRSLPQEPCPECEVEKDYYSLLEFHLQTAIAEFTFHLPYPLVKEKFPKDKLPKKEFVEEFARFGRKIDKSAYEHLLFPLKSLMKKVKQFVGQGGKK